MSNLVVFVVTIGAVAVMLAPFLIFVLAEAFRFALCRGMR
jgi:hypothetical protein